MKNALKAVAERVLPNPILYRLRARQAINRGDNPELRFLHRWHNGGSFIDVGANIGDWSRVASRIFHEVHVFEPIPRLAATLRRELPRNAKVYNVALSDEPGTAVLHIPIERDGRQNTGLASLDPEANGSASGGMTPVQVRVVRLDDQEFAGVDVIKIDVEGLEEKVLRGAIGTIQRCRPLLIVEIEDRHHPGETARVFHLLQAMMYRAHYLGADGQLVAYDIDTQVEPNVDGDGRYINNFIFVPLYSLWARLLNGGTQWID